VLVDELQHEFLIPQAAIRLWGAADEAFAGASLRAARQRRRAQPSPPA
jgi:hypothetical protein